MSEYIIYGCNNVITGNITAATNLPVGYAVSSEEHDIHEFYRWVEQQISRDKDEYIPAESAFLVKPDNAFVPLTHLDDGEVTIDSMCLPSWKTAMYEIIQESKTSLPVDRAIHVWMAFNRRITMARGVVTMNALSGRHTMRVMCPYWTIESVVQYLTHYCDRSRDMSRAINDVAVSVFMDKMATSMITGVSPTSAQLELFRLLQKQHTSKHASK